MVPELKLEGVRFRVYRDASMRASGHATAATLRRDSSDVVARDLATLLKEGEGDPVAITAPEGGGNLTAGTFWAAGGLTATRRDDAARTARAEYRPDGAGPGRPLVRGDQPIVASGNGYRLEGNGFTFDPTVGEIVVQRGAWLETEKANR